MARREKSRTHCLVVDEIADRREMVLDVLRGFPDLTIEDTADFDVAQRIFQNIHRQLLAVFLGITRGNNNIRKVEAFSRNTAVHRIPHTLHLRPDEAAMQIPAGRSQVLKNRDGIWVFEFGEADGMEGAPQVIREWIQNQVLGTI